MKISVIIPAYNCEKYIGQTLDMIRTQTFVQSDIETIIYLDGCTDNTADKIAQYTKTHRNMNIHAIKCETNQGPANARNIAIEHATGEYIHFLDADDCINTDFYLSLYNAVTRTNSDIAVANFIHERWPGDSAVYSQESVLSLSQDKQDFTRVDALGYATRYLIRRKFWEQNKFKFPPEMRICEDLTIMNIAIYYSNQIVLVPNAVYTYKFRPNSLLTTRSTRLIQNQYYHKACRDTSNFLSQTGLRPAAQTITKTRYKLFYFIPALHVTYYANGTRAKYKLFGFIPLLKFSCSTNKK